MVEMNRTRIKVKSSLVTSSDKTRIHAAKACREYNHKSFLAAGSQVKITGDFEVVQVEKVKKNNKPLYTTITLKGLGTITVPAEIAEKAQWK